MEFSFGIADKDDEKRLGPTFSSGSPFSPRFLLTDIPPANVSLLPKGIPRKATSDLWWRVYWKINIVMGKPDNDRLQSFVDNGWAIWIDDRFDMYQECWLHRLQKSSHGVTWEMQVATKWHLFIRYETESMRNEFVFMNICQKWTSWSHGI